jgi:cytoskeleton protein RodZ
MALPAIKHEPAPEPAAEPPADAAPAGRYQVRLKLKEASWVEIVGTDGRKLEFGLLPAGAERSYGTDVAVTVRLGNANGAEVDVNGKPVDLQPFRRANVAHLKLVDGNAVAPGASPSAN